MSFWDALTGRKPSSSSSASPQSSDTFADSAPSTTFQSPSAPSFSSPSASDMDMSSFLKDTTLPDPSALHPLAGLNQSTLDYLSLEESALSDLPGSQSALPSRGWSDDLCYGTGVTYLTALTMGGTWGLVEGLNRSPASAPPKLRLNSVLNSVTRRGPFLGNSAGVVALVYNGFNSTLGYYRGKHDAANSIVAGALSGMLFKSTRGFKPMAISAGIVASVAGAWAYVVISVYPGGLRNRDEDVKPNTRLSVSIRTLSANKYNKLNSLPTGTMAQINLPSEGPETYTPNDIISMIEEQLLSVGEIGFGFTWKAELAISFDPSLPGLDTLATLDEDVDCLSSAIDEGIATWNRAVEISHIMQDNIHLVDQTVVVVHERLLEAGMSQQDMNELIADKVGLRDMIAALYQLQHPKPEEPEEIAAWVFAENHMQKLVRFPVDGTFSDMTTILHDVLTTMPDTHSRVDAPSQWLYVALNGRGRVKNGTPRLPLLSDLDYREMTRCKRGRKPSVAIIKTSMISGSKDAADRESENEERGEDELDEDGKPFFD